MGQLKWFQYTDKEDKTSKNHTSCEIKTNNLYLLFNQEINFEKRESLYLT